jgi:hypothetical protein
LATLLLIVIAVAAITVTYAWIMTYMGNTTEKAGVMLYEGNTFFNATASPKSIVLDIGNSGTSATQIVSVYVGTSSSAMQAVAPVYAAGNSSSLAAGSITSFTVTPSGGWAASTTYYFRVVSTAGQQALEFQEKSP